MSRRSHNPKASDSVVWAIGSGCTPLADGLAALECYNFEHRQGRGVHRQINLRAGERTVQVTISPTGQRVGVYVDGTEVKPQMRA